MDQSTRVSLEEFWSMLTDNMRQVRNQIYHASMPVIEHEKRAYPTGRLAPTASRIVLDKQTGQLIHAREEIGLTAERLATEFHKSDRNVIAILQVLTEEQYQIIIGRHPDWNREKETQAGQVGNY